MSATWIRLFVVSLCLLLPARVFAVDVAVMPVQGVNLSEGESDAIGVLFANAFASEARAVVASPLHTKPLRGEGKSSAAIATQLGAARFVELKALRLEQQVQVSAVLHGQDGGVLYQAETSAWSLEAMDTATARLARALAYREPIAAMPPPYAPAAPLVPSYEPPPAAPVRADPNRTVHDHGAKLGIVQPRASGKSFSPGVLIEFDARYGPPSHFFEFGAGLIIPTDDDYNTAAGTIRATSGFLELGGSYYLWSGSAAIYLGGGLTPAVWTLETGQNGSYSTHSHTAATCGAHGQAGITFTRLSRVKLFAEVRVTQLLLAVTHSTNASYYSETLADPYRPMYLAFQGGLVW